MWIFDKLLRRGAEPEPDPGVIEELRNQVVLWVHPGFYSRADVLAYAQEFRDGNELALTDRELEQAVDEVWQARLAEQHGWPEQTDADRPPSRSSTRPGWSPG